MPGSISSNTKRLNTVSLKSQKTSSLSRFLSSAANLPANVWTDLSCCPSASREIVSHNEAMAAVSIFQLTQIRVVNFQ